MITLREVRPYTRDGDVVAPSPNHSARAAPVIEGIVLHATADAGNELGTLSWLCSPKSGVSCHLLVSRTGQVTRLVGDHHCAWHAGLSWWRGTSDVNSITLGIEIANRNDGEPYTDAQYGRVADIVAHYLRQGLSLDDVVSHGAIAEERRTDPLGWDWDRFRAMVQERLRAPDVDGGPLYDRRSNARGGASKPQAPAVNTPKPKAPVITTDRRRAPTTTTPKRFLCSRTLWLNGLTVIAAASGIALETGDLPYSIGLTLPDEIMWGTVPDEFAMWALLCVGMVNFVLRFWTTCPVGSSQGEHGSPPATAIRMPQRAPGPDTRRASGADNGKVAAGPR